MQYLETEKLKEGEIGAKINYIGLIALSLSRFCTLAIIDVICRQINIKPSTIVNNMGGLQRITHTHKKSIKSSIIQISTMALMKYLLLIKT